MVSDSVMSEMAHRLVFIWIHQIRYDWTYNRHMICYMLIMNAATILCIRVLDQLDQDTVNLIELDSPATVHLGTLQTFAIRIVAAPGECYDNYQHRIQDVQYENNTFLQALVLLVEDSYGKGIAKQFHAFLTK